MKKCYCEELCTQLTTFVVEVWVLLAKNKYCKHSCYFFRIHLSTISMYFLLFE